MDTTKPASDTAFSPAVKAVQARKGSREAYAKMDGKGGWTRTITEDLARFIAERDSFYIAIASADGQPYAQHRGGAPGFLKVLDERTLAFADYRGNRQYITAGNLSENARAFLFLMDYPNRRRIKIWGRARVVDDDPELLARLAEGSDAPEPEQAIEIFKMFGGEDILCFASDYPHWDGDEVDHIARSLPAAWHEKVFRENAMQLFGW